MEIINAEQLSYVERIHVPGHLGPVTWNVSLLENVFCLIVCIVNQISAFLVGKPGCSKTLAMQLIFEILRGKDSNFPEFACLFEQQYQCSKDSTSEGIEAIFKSKNLKEMEMMLLMLCSLTKLVII